MLNWELNLVPIKIILTSCFSDNDFLVDVFIDFI